MCVAAQHCCNAAAAPCTGGAAHARGDGRTHAARPAGAARATAAGVRGARRARPRARAHAVRARPWRDTQLAARVLVAVRGFCNSTCGWFAPSGHAPGRECALRAACTGRLMRTGVCASRAACPQPSLVQLRSVSCCGNAMAQQKRRGFSDSSARSGTRARGAWRRRRTRAQPAPRRPGGSRRLRRRRPRPQAPAAWPARPRCPSSIAGGRRLTAGATPTGATASGPWCALSQALLHESCLIQAELLVVVLAACGRRFTHDRVGYPITSG